VCTTEYLIFNPYGSMVVAKLNKHAIKKVVIMTVTNATGCRNTVSVPDV
jgi:hypothetical protein